MTTTDSDLGEKFIEALGVLSFQLVGKDQNPSTTRLTFHRTQWFDNEDDNFMPTLDPTTATGGFDADHNDGVVTFVIPTSESEAWPIGAHVLATFTPFTPVS